MLIKNKFKLANEDKSCVQSSDLELTSMNFCNFYEIIYEI